MAARPLAEGDEGLGEEALEEEGLGEEAVGSVNIALPSDELGAEWKRLRRRAAFD